MSEFDETDADLVSLGALINKQPWANNIIMETHFNIQLAFPSRATQQNGFVI